MLQFLQRRALIRPRSPVGAVATTPVTTSFRQSLDEKVAVLSAKKLEWRSLSIGDKALLLQEVRKRILDNMRSWATENAALRGLKNDQFAVAESFLVTSVVMDTYIRSLLFTLEHLAQHGKCPDVEVRTLPSGQQVAKVFPLSAADKADVSLLGVTGELYIKPGQPATRGGFYLQGGGDLAEEAQLTVLLGAGNVGFLAFKDALHMLYERGHVVLLKPHPVQANWQRFADYVLEPLASRGFLQTIYASTLQETQELIHHPAVERLHMTGGTATHDAIVWGPTPEEQRRRKAANDPLLKVPITSELGCVTPWLVTPGEWTEAQLSVQATNTAMAAQFNNSCACNSLKVLLLPQCWPQADAFLTKLKAQILELPALPAWYPGHNARYDAWRRTFPDAEVLPQEPWKSSCDFNGAQAMPFAVAEVPYPEPGQPLTEQQRYAFSVEPFAPTLVVVRVPGGDTPAYLQAAVQLANKQLWGTLSCSMLVHPDAERDYPQAVQQAIDELKYGTVGINCFSGVAYMVPHTTWGAFDGDQTLQDVGSGIGMVNNTLLFDNVQKSVVRQPIDGVANQRPMAKRGLPAWAVPPLTGLLLDGVRGAVKATLFSR